VGSPAQQVKFYKNKCAGLPLPIKTEARPLIAIGTTPYLPLPKSVVLLDLLPMLVFKLVTIPGAILKK
jgi:hypothetical protein